MEERSRTCIDRRAIAPLLTAHRVDGDGSIVAIAKTAATNWQLLQPVLTGLSFKLEIYFNAFICPLNLMRQKHRFR